RGPAGGEQRRPGAGPLPAHRHRLRPIHRRRMGDALSVRPGSGGWHGRVGRPCRTRLKEEQMTQSPPAGPGQQPAVSRRTLLSLGLTGAGVTALGATALDMVAGQPAAAAPPPGRGAGPLRVSAPTIEYAPQLLGTDVRKPRLSWTATAPGHNAAQSAYRILVATRPDRLAPGVADVWDSGKVASPRAVGVPYDGPTLAPRTRYYWSVRLWDRAGRATDWAEP